MNIPLRFSTWFLLPDLNLNSALLTYINIRFFWRRFFQVAPARLHLKPKKFSHPAVLPLSAEELTSPSYPATAVSHNVEVSRNAVHTWYHLQAEKPWCTRDNTTIEHLLESPRLCFNLVEEYMCSEEILHFPKSQTAKWTFAVMIALQCRLMHLITTSGLSRLLKWYESEDLCSQAVHKG